MRVRNLEYEDYSGLLRSDYLFANEQMLCDNIVISISFYFPIISFIYILCFPGQISVRG